MPSTSTQARQLPRYAQGQAGAAASGYPGVPGEVAEAVEKALKLLLEGLKTWKILDDHSASSGGRAWIIENRYGSGLRVTLRGSPRGPVLVVGDRSDSRDRLEIEIPDKPFAAFLSTIYIISSYLVDPEALNAEKEVSKIIRSGVTPALDRILSLYTPLARQWYQRASETITALALAEGLSKCFDNSYCKKTSIPEEYSPEIVLLGDTRPGEATVLINLNVSGEPRYMLRYDTDTDEATLWAGGRKIAVIREASRLAASIMLRNIYTVLSPEAEDIIPDSTRDKLSSIYPGNDILIIPELEAVSWLELLDRGSTSELAKKIPGFYSLLLVSLPRLEKRLAKYGIDVNCQDCFMAGLLRKARKTVIGNIEEAIASLLPLAVTAFGGEDTAYRVVELASSILRGLEPPSPDTATKKKKVLDKLRPLYEKAREASEKARNGWRGEEAPELEDVVAAFAYSLALEYLAKQGKNKSLLDQILGGEQEGQPDTWIDVAATVIAASSMHPFMAAHYSKEYNSYWLSTIESIIHPLKASIENDSAVATSILVARMLSLDALWATLTINSLTTMINKISRSGDAVSLVATDKGVRVRDGNGKLRKIRSLTEAALDSLARIIALIETGIPVYDVVEARIASSPDNEYNEVLEVSVKTKSGEIKYRYNTFWHSRGLWTDKYKVMIRSLYPFDENTKRVEHILFFRAHPAAVIAASIASGLWGFRELGLLVNNSMKDAVPLLYSIIVGNEELSKNGYWSIGLELDRRGKRIGARVVRGGDKEFRTLLEMLIDVYRGQGSGIPGPGRAVAVKIQCPGGCIADNSYTEAYLKLLRPASVDIADVAELGVFLKIRYLGSKKSKDKDVYRLSVLARFDAYNKYTASIVSATINRLLDGVGEALRKVRLSENSHGTVSFSDIVSSFSRWVIGVKSRGRSTAASITVNKIVLVSELEDLYRVLDSLAKAVEKFANGRRGGDNSPSGNIEIRGYGVIGALLEAFTYINSKSQYAMMDEEQFEEKLADALSLDRPPILVSWRSYLKDFDNILNTTFFWWLDKSWRTWYTVGMAFHPASIYLVEKTFPAVRLFKDVDELGRHMLNKIRGIIQRINDSKVRGRKMDILLVL